MRGRLDLCPYDALLKHLRGPASILDVGCGYGHLAWYLRAKLPGLRYFGTDIDANKIAVANASRVAEASRVSEASLIAEKNISVLPEFRVGDVRVQPDFPATFGNIVFLDVLYLMPWELQCEILRWAFTRLATGSEASLVIKSMDEAKGFTGWRAVAEEWVMVRVLKKTVSSGELNGARSVVDYRELAAAAGLKSELETLGTFNPSYYLCIHR